jgi:hypothetical protein
MEEPMSTERQRTLYVDTGVWKAAGEKSKKREGRPISRTGGHIVTAYGDGLVTPVPTDTPDTANRDGKLILITDGPWQAAEKRAVRDGTSVSAALESLLIAYTAGRLRIVTTVVQDPAAA